MNRRELIKQAYAYGAAVALQELGYDINTAQSAGIKLAEDEEGMHPALKALIGTGVGLGGGALLGGGAGAIAGKATGRNLGEELVRALGGKGVKMTSGEAPSALHNLMTGVPGVSRKSWGSATSKSKTLADLQDLIEGNPVAGSANIGARGGALLGALGGGIGGPFVGGED